MKVIGFPARWARPEAATFAAAAMMAGHPNDASPLGLRNLPFMIFMAWAFEMRIHWIGKDALFRGPMGWFMRKMGGIWRKIPFTYAYMWIGSLALSGIPFFAGYYSKDIILESAWGAGSLVGQYAFWLGIGAAFMTATLPSAMPWRISRVALPVLKRESSCSGSNTLFQHI